MPRAVESPISRMLRFFKDSSREVAEIGLDLATEVVRAKKASVSASAAAASLATALTPAAPVRQASTAKKVTATQVAKPTTKTKAKGKPGRKPLPEGTLTRAQILQRARDAKKKKAREAAKAAASAAGGTAKGKKAKSAAKAAKVPPPPGPAAKPKRRKRRKAAPATRKAAPSTAVERRTNLDEGHLPADKLPAQRHPVDAESELFDNGEVEMLDPIGGELDFSPSLDD